MGGARRLASVAVAAGLVAAPTFGCGPGGGPDRAAPGGTGPAPAAGPGSTSPSPDPPDRSGPPSPTAPAASTTGPPGAGGAGQADVQAEVEVAYRVEVRSPDPALAGFAGVVDRVLGDPRGWSRARFRFVPRADAPFLVVLAEPDEAHQLCLPYDVYRRYSCQNGPVVVVNAERWRRATPQWTGDLATYRDMVVNHEVGHLLGMRHPAVQCPRPGRPAAVMAQQSTELDGCLPNPWPLDEEVERAGRHDLPLAPPYRR